jgi:hypothetical protein
MARPAVVTMGSAADACSIYVFKNVSGAIQADAIRGHPERTWPEHNIKRHCNNTSSAAGYLSGDGPSGFATRCSCRFPLAMICGTARPLGDFRRVELLSDFAFNFPEASPRSILPLIP